MGKFKKFPVRDNLYLTVVRKLVLPQPQRLHCVLPGFGPFVTIWRENVEAVFLYEATWYGIASLGPDICLGSRKSSGPPPLTSIFCPFNPYPRGKTRRASHPFPHQLPPHSSHEVPLDTSWNECYYYILGRGLGGWGITARWSSCCS